MRRHPGQIDVRALERFLLVTPPLAPDGRVLSWMGDGGFGYDESTAILARLARVLRPEASAPFTDRVDAQLDHDGWLGKDGVGYTFDTALALAITRRRERTSARVAAWLHEQAACSDRSPMARWSTTFGPHLIKAAAELAAFGEGGAAYDALARDVVAPLVASCFRDGRFRVAPGASETYVHAHCYAVEGLVSLGGYEAVVDEALATLRTLQADDGSFPAWVGAPEARRPMDVVAQAARLFLAVPGPDHAERAERALACLGASQHATGGVRYTAESSHVNVWTSAFALQAARWAEAPRPAGRPFFV